MNYIQEELLRQKLLLTELLLRESNSAVRNRESAEEAEMLMYAPEDTFAEQLETTAARTIHAKISRQRQGLMTETAERKPEQIYRNTGAARQPFWKDRSQIVPQQDRVDSVIQQTISNGRGTQADARQLSRAVQRDARRYDGGFSIY